MNGETFNLHLDESDALWVHTLSDNFNCSAEDFITNIVKNTRRAFDTTFTYCDMPIKS